MLGDEVLPPGVVVEELGDAGVVDEPLGDVDESAGMAGLVGMPGVVVVVDGVVIGGVVVVPVLGEVEDGGVADVPSGALAPGRFGSGVICAVANPAATATAATAATLAILNMFMRYSIDEIR